MRADRDVTRDARLLCSADWNRAVDELVERFKEAVKVPGFENKELRHWVGSVLMRGATLGRVGFEDTRPEHE